MLGTMMEVIDSSIINIALPNMMGSLGANLDEVTWMVTGYIVANVTIVPISGWLSMRFGRKRYFLVSIALFTIASILCSFVHNLYLLILIRILQGIGGGALVPTSQAILMETFPPEEQGTAMSIFGFGMMVCPSIGSMDKKDIPSASGIYNLMRQLGGSFGIAILVALLTRGEATHRVNLIQHIHTLNPLAVQRLDTLEQGLLARGEDLVSAKLGALKLLDQTIHIQALMLSFVDGFRFLVTLILLSLPLLFLFKKG